MTKKLIKRSIKDKMKFAFSESRIEQLIETISRLNQAMQTLLQQTGILCERRCVSQPSKTTKRKIAQFNAVKVAAGNLYNALSRACTKHLEHQVHLSLQPVHNGPSQVRFTLAMKHMSLRPASNESGLRRNSRLWLTVESNISGTLHSGNEMAARTKAWSGPRRTKACGKDRFFKRSYNDHQKDQKASSIHATGTFCCSNRLIPHEQ